MEKNIKSIGNKLIAEFMGFVSTNTEEVWDTIPYCDKLEDLTIGIPCSVPITEELYFNKSWDWLMPVVEKISALYFDVIIYSDACRIDTWEDSIPVDALVLIDKFEKEIYIATYYKSTSKIGANTLIEAVYKAIVEFIEWYNKQTIKNEKN